MSYTKNKIFIFIILLFVSIVYVLIITSNTDNNNEKISDIEINNAKCIINDNSCLIENEIFNLNLSLDRDITYLKPFNITAVSETKKNNKIKKIQLDFKMKGMDMGMNRFLLKSANPGEQPQRWQGTGLLPICVSGRADWIVELNVYVNNSRYILQFPIVVTKNSR